MSVLLECQPGDAIICVQEFNAAPDGQPFSWQSSHTFHVGDHLRFVGSRQNPNFLATPNEWMVLFESPQVGRFAAAQSYFVTEDAWQKIEDFFSDQARSAGANRSALPAAN